MLQILRKKAQSTFIQIIVVVIALVFIFWGVGTNMTGNRQAALVVNGEEITFQQFQQAYDRAYQRLSDQFGGNVPKGLAETFGIKQQVINQLIQASLLRQGAEKMGIRVSGQEISQVIEEMVQFQDNGSFSMEQYKAVLAANRMAPTKFETSMRFDRLSEVAAREIGNFASVATDFEVQEIYSQMNEKVSLKYVKISPEQYESDVTIEDEALKEWFETVKDNYKTDPEIKLKYLAFTINDIGSKIEIDQAKIEEYYQANLDKYKAAEQRHARHILFQTKEEDSPQVHEEKKMQAEEILKLAKNGGDFAELAKLHSEGPSKTSGGDLGFFSRGRMVPAFDEVVFDMQVGDISEVVKTRFGYHIIFLEEIKPPSTRPLEEVTAEVTKTLQRKEAESLAFQVANDAYEGIIGAGSLAKYVEANTDKEIVETEFFPKNNSPATLKQDSEFLNKAFELNKGELSSLIKGRTGYAILFAEDLKEPEIPAFNAIKSSLKADYKKANSKELAKAAADELLKGVREGKDFDAVAHEQGLSVSQSGLIGKNSPDEKEEFPTALNQSAFQLSSASPLPEVPGEVDGNYYVYSFLAREIPTLPEDPEEIKTYQDNLLRFKQQQLLSAWLRNLEIDAEITRHQSL